jgi:hypothetical protein
MRLSLVGPVLVALIGVTSAPATAEEGAPASATVEEATPPSSAGEGWSRTSRYHYETCNCHFGYGDSCQVAVACTNEGGYCSSSRPCDRDGRSNAVVHVLD